MYEDCVILDELYKIDESIGLELWLIDRCKLHRMEFNKPKSR